MPIMLEAVMRVRASKGKSDFCSFAGATQFFDPGLRMASFHGNFFVRSTDLLAMPAVPTDQSYAIEVQIEDTITAPFVVFQTAVLHTTCYGERRIRVVTHALPTTSSLSEVFASADQVAIATLLANKGVERALTHKLEDSRDAILQRMVDILTSYKSSMTAAGAGASAQLAISENLKMLPVLVLGLLKNVGSLVYAVELCDADSQCCRFTRLVSVKALRFLPIFEHTRRHCLLRCRHKHSFLISIPRSILFIICLLRCFSVTLLFCLYLIFLVL